MDVSKCYIVDEDILIYNISKYTLGKIDFNFNAYSNCIRNKTNKFFKNSNK